jgi:hypothetical protein
MVAAHQSGESKGRLKRKALQTDLLYQVLRSMKALPALAAKLRTARLCRLLFEVQVLSE